MNHLVFKDDGTFMYELSKWPIGRSDFVPKHVFVLRSDNVWFYYGDCYLYTLSTDKVPAVVRMQALILS